MKKIQENTMRTYAPVKRTLIDLTLSENPLGSSSKVKEAIIEAIEQVHLYPYEENKLICALAKHHELAEGNFMLGHGANQLLSDIISIFAQGKSVVVPFATFPESITAVRVSKGKIVRVPLQADLSLDLKAMLKAVQADTALIHLCNPNNPTSIWTEISSLLQLADHSPVPLLISEAGADFIGQTLGAKPIHPNIIVVRSFSKAYGLAGLRIGYAVATEDKISMIKSSLGSYRVNTLAIAAAIAALKDQCHLNHSIAYMLREKAWLMHEMNNLGFKVVPSQGQNFIAKVPTTFRNANCFCQCIEKHGISVVNCSLYVGLEKYVRLTPQKREINEMYISKLKNIMEIK